ncbi:MAG: (Fe-S)-binding protein [Epsilonproteobacteria bacterium]|nr:(Fe-S)-binding protein [Campylobacterota bacterium]
MKLALFIPCYVKELYPNVVKSTILLLDRLGYKVDIPKSQTCCGQAFVNSGQSTNLAKRMDNIFHEYDEVIGIGSSCVSFTKSQGYSIANKIYELTDFLYQKGHRNLATNYPKKIAFHHSCHSIRHLALKTPSELNIPFYDKVKDLLGVEIMQASKDECCGFGGVYSLKEGFLSYVMGRSKLDDLLLSNPDVISGVDMSCLMHLQSIAQKDNDNIQFKHISEIILESLDETLQVS